MTTKPTAIQPTGLSWSAVLPFAGAIFFSAFLLFQVQPLIGKYVLPWFGGAPAVWTTCMLFFQTLLLGGYAYAHLSSRLLSHKMQSILHVLLLIAALCVLPIVPSPRWKPTAGDDPTLHIIVLLSVSVGLPYFVLSATGPLLQSWFARRWPDRPPYRLYALSNLGSFLALLSYPVLIEPLLSRREQALMWSISLAIFAVICAACAINFFKSAAQNQSPTNVEPKKTSSPHLVLWLLLPACASLLLLAVTNKICQDIAVIPLLWILPLAVYLLSFAICFDSPKYYDRRLFVPLTLASLAVVCWVAFPGHDDLPVPQRISAYIVALFACCMVCHGELYRLRPPANQLTRFYLLIAAGGMLGGLFVDIVAPLVFTSYTELQIGFMLAYVLLMFRLQLRRPVFILFSIIGGTALVMVLWVTATSHLSGSETLVRERNFYGVLTVYEQGAGTEKRRLLHHGGVTHGLQLSDSAFRNEPTTYYGPQSGVGLAIRSLPPSQSHQIGIIGLGAGTLATYGRAEDVIRFYEINPLVIDLAKQWFTFLSDSKSKIDIITGDARISLEAETPQHFDLLAVDAFSGDAIPIHLLTAECLDLYLYHLADRGIIAIHVSNHHLNLAPIVRRLAAHAHLAVVKIEAIGDGFFQENSEWMLLARDGSLFNGGLIGRALTPPPSTERAAPLWTDDYSDLIRILR